MTCLLFIVVTDTKPTSTAGDSSNIGLKIYFADEDNDDRQNRLMTDKTNIKQLENDETGDRLHKLLLTSNDEKTINSRHGLYKNPKKFEIKFRTESPSSLRTVASPLLVQNSVKNRLNENTRRRLRDKRGTQNQRNIKAKDRTGSRANVWPKTFSVNGASWFKRYQAIYNEMLKRSGPGAKQPFNTAINEKLGYNNHNDPQKKTMQSTDYYYNYVYPLYHLHSIDNYVHQRQGSIQNSGVWGQNEHNIQMRSRNIVPGTRNYQSLARSTIFTNKQQNTILQQPASYVSSRPSAVGNQNLMSRHLLQEMGPTNLIGGKSGMGAKNAKQVTENARRASSITDAKEQKRLNAAPVTQEHTLHKIGLKDDASFMEATPNYDSSVLTLHAMQSLIPKAKVRDMIPKLQRRPFLTAKASIERNDFSRNSMNEAPSRRALLPMGSGIRLQNILQVNALNNWQGQNMPGNALSDNAFLIKSRKSQINEETKLQRSEISRPDIKPNTKQIALSFYKETEKPRIEFPPENDNEKRDVIYKSVDPLSEIDSDDVTAENLAAIFNELDGQVDETMHEVETKKDEVARPQNDLRRTQDEIEMTVYDVTKNTPLKKSGAKIVKVTDGNGVETNLQQGFDIGPIENDEAVGSLKDTIIKPRFNLKRLHFGLRNGNMFE